MPSSGDETAGEGAADSAADGSPHRGADAALAAAIDATDGDPECALCSKPADYFLYEAGHVEKFVCWEHVSPHSAAVDGDDARPGRPLALSL